MAQMSDKDESSEKKYLVPSTGHTLARRSDALVSRGIRDLEAVEHAQRFRNHVQQAGQLALARQQQLKQMEVSPHGPFVEANKQRTERILAVNDEETVRGIISSMLIAAGYQCRVVAGGLEALALLESGEKFDLLLTDMLNSPLDGFSLLQRTKERFPDIPVVVASAVNDDALVDACIRSGACEYLFLPFDHEQLLATVSRALKHRRMQRENHK